MSPVLTDELLRSCPDNRWSGADDRCRWCDGILEGRRTRWCSDDCANEWGRNHAWSQASSYARARATACAKCGITVEEISLELAIAERWKLVLRVICGYEPAPRWDPEAPREERGRLNRAWSIRRDQAGWGKVEELLKRLRLERSFETNHVDPVLGRHGEIGCHHHQDGLEVLCHRCHVEVTAEQFGYRRPNRDQLALEGLG